MKTTDENPTYGSGQHSHAVPALAGRVVLMRDGQHEGTEIYRVAGDDPSASEFRFVSLDQGAVATKARCVLVRLTGVGLETLPEPYGCDLDSPEGMALVGLDELDEVGGLGDVLWDSLRSDGWNAYRYPTEDEVANGRFEADMVFVGNAPTESLAEALLRGAGGELQKGLAGAVVNVEPRR